jgi:hypothetical protein
VAPDTIAVAKEQTLAQAGCRDHRGGAEIAQACARSLSLLTCSAAKKEELGCCVAACSMRIEDMRSAVIESAAQECAARSRLAPLPVNLVCDFTLPNSSLRREQMTGPCLERCRELVSGLSVVP